MFAKSMKDRVSSKKILVDELQQIYNDIETKEKEIKAEKAKMKEEFSNGSRLTKHRFSL
ncbi:hypothetical protein [Serratia fonticola]|jgi:hypothetical protein